ncbi:MAG: hypothetical protein JNL36_02035 [Candidatus Kapabacteria bacterium]|nr:hypothetical protein [Candidatus Kapabacteria bacterium]
MKTYFLLLVSFFTMNMQFLANTDGKTVFSLSKTSIETAISELIAKSTDSITSITFTTTVDEYDSFLEPIIAQILQERGINFLGKLPIKKSLHLRMQTEEFSLKWKVLEQFQDSLEENGVLRGRIIATTASMQTIVAPINSSFKTNVSINEAKRTLKLVPSIIVSELPQTNTSIVEEILTPVLYLGTAVITLLLLFTVRTQ